MLNRLLTFLKHELLILNELSEIADKQQRALVKYEIGTLEQITKYQEELTKNLRNTEEQRITLLMAWLKITQAEARNFRLSIIEQHVNGDELKEVRKLKKDMRKLLSYIHNTISTNRVLAHRAQNTINQIIYIFTNGTNHVFNVRI
jgi:flagellar biosynthesis/type III secretory pathway chaperone